MTESCPLAIYQLRVVLCGVSPMIWRRLLVRSDTNLAQLHQFLQAAFGWGDYYLHEFRIHGKHLGSNACDPRSLRLADFRLHRGERFRYCYNFFDFWQCDLRLEAILPFEPTRNYPVCTRGKRAAPAEDCGGAWAYLQRLDHHKCRPPTEELGLVAEAMQRFLETKERASLGDLYELEDALDRIRAYQDFDPERFDRRQLNAELRALTGGEGGEA